MKRHGLGLLIYLWITAIFIMTSVFVYANPVEVSIYPEEMKAYVDQYTIFRLTLKNNQNYSDDIVLSARGEHLEWLNMGSYYVFLKPNDSVSIDIGVYPKKLGRYRYTIDVISEKSNTKDSVSFSINIVENITLAIKGLSSKRDGSIVRAHAIIESTVPKMLEINFELRDDKNNLIDSSAKRITVNGTASVDAELKLPEMVMAGNYVVMTTIKGMGMTRSTSFAVPPVHNVEKTITKKANLWHEEFTITIHNKGNVIEKKYAVEEGITLAHPFYLDAQSMKPFQITKSGNKITYKWVIGSIMPGEKIEIRYRFEYWPSYVFYIVMLIVLAGVGYHIYIRLTKPSLRKSAHKHGRDVLITIEIKGPWIGSIKDLIIKDRITPLAKMVKEFDTPKPVIRVSDAGTELVWKLPELKARDEMIYYYRIKPLIEANLKMPSAYMRFKKGKKTVMVHSNQITIE